MVKEHEVVYEHGGVRFRGHVAYEDETVQLPAVLIAHAWRGCDAFVRTKAAMLAKDGYVGFALDLYGEGREAKTDDEAHPRFWAPFVLVGEPAKLKN